MGARAYQISKASKHRRERVVKLLEDFLDELEEEVPPEGPRAPLSRAQKKSAIEKVKKRRQMAAEVELLVNDVKEMREEIGLRYRRKTQMADEKEVVNPTREAVEHLPSRMEGMPGAVVVIFFALFLCYNFLGLESVRKAQP